MTVGTPNVDATHYEPSPTGERYLDSRSFFRGIVGPIGSGKSVLCTIDLLQLGYDMPPTPDGWRRSRCAVVRNTYRELEDTTMRTVFDWVPKHSPYHGITWSESDMTWTMHDERNQVHIEWLFRALDRPDHVRKLLSLELTHAWLNEAREIPLPIVDMLIGRLGRYPSMRDYGWKTDPEKVVELIESGREPVVGEDIPYWYGLLGDTNPPDDESWWYTKFEVERPAGWEVFHQPSARSREAENLQNLHPLYYQRLMAGKSDDWIAVYVDGKYGYVQDGKPIHPMFHQAIHVSEEADEWNPRLPAAFGADFGLTPAAVLGQKQPSGQWRIRDEVVTEDTGAERFGEELRIMLNSQRYAGFYSWHGWGDPAGDERSVIRESETVINVLQGQGLPIDSAPSNDPVLRQGALDFYLGRLDVIGKPAIIIHPRCSTLIKGLAGRYQYRRIQAPGVARYSEKPDKNKWSHVCEGLHYMLLGEGEGETLIAGQAALPEKPKVHKALRGATVRRDQAGKPNSGVRIL